MFIFRGRLSYHLTIFLHISPRYQQYTFHCHEPYHSSIIRYRYHRQDGKVFPNHVLFQQQIHLNMHYDLENRFFQLHVSVLLSIAQNKNNLDKFRMVAKCMNQKIDSVWAVLPSGLLYVRAYINFEEVLEEEEYLQDHDDQQQIGYPTFCFSVLQKDHRIHQYQQSHILRLLIYCNNLLPLQIIINWICLFIYRIIYFQNSMEQLNRLLQDASNQFQCHNFQTSLDLYLRCIEKCEKERLPKSILFNLKSSQAALRTILGQFEQALTVCNEVLQGDKYHWLCLLRRSQIYKKQFKFKKSMKDLERMALFAPDNMQVAALKLEIKGLMSRPEQVSSEEQSEQLENQEKLLQFSNLKRIDRTSVSIMMPRGRQSRVTISGDSAFFYQSAETTEKRQSVYYAPQFICQRFIDIDEELKTLDTQEPQNEPIVPIIKAKPSRGKSILKNRQSELFVAQKIEKKENQGKRLIEKLKDIEGKLIKSQNSMESEKEVGFRKSIFNEGCLTKSAEKPLVSKKKGPRKSCLKRASFEVDNEEVQKKTPRRSKFDILTRNSIDGKLIKSDKKRLEAMKEGSKENIGSVNNQSDDDSESGSFNIFGNNKVELTKELRENLGLSSSDFVSEEPKKKKERKMSILKKSSIMITDKKKVSIFCRENEQLKAPERKAKKSVMFKQ